MHFVNALLLGLVLSFSSGQLLAAQYEEDLTRRINWAFEVMGPLVIFFLAGMALILIMGVLLPIYDLVTEISSQTNQSF